MVRPGMNNPRAFTEEFKPKSRMIQSELEAPNQAVFRSTVHDMGHNIARDAHSDTVMYAREEEGIFFHLSGVQAPGPSIASEKAGWCGAAM